MRTVHRADVPEELLEGLGLTGVDRARIVYETFSFLLEREPASAIQQHFPLDRVVSYFPDYYDELRVRLRA